MASRSPAKGKAARAKRTPRTKPVRAARPAKAATRRPAVRRRTPVPGRPPAAVRPGAPAAGAERGAALREQFLERMRQMLLAKRKELVSEVRERNLQSIQASAEVIQDIADQASTAYTKEFLLSIGDAERRLLQQVDDALQRFRRKSYGLCDKCGEPIGEKRLEALPFAKLCIRCQEEEEERR